jgi:hypothetical protein
MPGQVKPKVEVVAGQDREDVVIKLGIKPAYLDVSIKSDDNKSISAANVVFSRPDLPGDYRTSVADGGRLPIPATVPVRMSVEVPGYVAWVYRDTEGRDTMKLSSGEVQSIDVTLRHLN